MDLARRIEELWEADALDAEVVEEAVATLDRGEVRVAERRDGEWQVNEWVKKAILLYFRVRKVEPLEVGALHFLDKIPVKADYAERGVRVVPPGVARYGAFLSEGVVLMPGRDSSTSAPGSARGRWWTRLRRSARARRSAPTSTSPAASESVASSSPRRRDP
jgi:hypothetical protein